MIYATMAADSIKAVAVIGAGLMGKRGIAHRFSRAAGYRVILRDVEQRYLERGMETPSTKISTGKWSAKRKNHRGR